MNLGFGSGCRLASKPEPRLAAASRLMISRPDHDGRKPARIRRAGPRGVAFFRRPGAGGGRARRRGGIAPGGSRGGGAARMRQAGRKMRDCAARRRAGPAGAGPRDPAPPGLDRRAFPRRRAAAAGPADRPGPRAAPGGGPAAPPPGAAGKSPAAACTLASPPPGSRRAPGLPRPPRSARESRPGSGAFSARGRPGTAPRPDAGRGLAPPARAPADPPGPVRRTPLPGPAAAPARSREGARAPMPWHRRRASRARPAGRGLTCSSRGCGAISAKAPPANAPLMRAVPAIVAVSENAPRPSGAGILWRMLRYGHCGRAR